MVSKEVECCLFRNYWCDGGRFGKTLFLTARSPSQVHRRWIAGTVNIWLVRDGLPARSVADIVIGAFRYCVNEPNND